MVIVPLSATLGTLSLILVQPVQSNLETKLPECNIQSSNSRNLSDRAANSELNERTLREQVSSLASTAPPNCHNRAQPMQVNSRKAKKPIDSQIETKQKQEQQKLVNQLQRIKVSSPQSQSSNSTNLSVIAIESGLIDSKSTPIERESNMASPEPHQYREKTSSTQTNYQEAEERIEPETETKKQSKQLSYVERVSIEPRPIVASVTLPQHSDETKPVQTDFQVEKEPTEQKLPNGKQKVNLTLADTVNLAVQNNRTIKNSYLQRIIDRQDLAVAEDEFVPNFIPEVFWGFNQRLQRDTQELSVSGDLEVKMPIGATLGVTSDNIGQGLGINELDFRVTFDQPLLRGFGVDVNLAPIEIARLEEKVNLLNLKSTLIGTITDAIEAYLRLLQAQEQIEIEKLALESAKRRLEIIQALIDAGRRARVELVQSETDVANREVSLLAAQNTLAQARLDLIEILDLEQNLELVATEIQNPVESIALDSDKLTQLAFANNPEYLQSLRRLEIAKFNLLLAENEQLWGLDFQVSYGLTNRTNIDDQTDVRAGIILSREFGNVSLEQSVERSQVRLEQSNNDMHEARESLKIEINNRIRDVQFNLQQIEQARKARELSEQQLENEREKLRLGVRGARLIDVLNFENDLVQAKNRELNTMINYLSALTRLEETVGITLDKWNIEMESVVLVKKD